MPRRDAFRILSFLLAATFLSAQDYRARIQGLVSDPTQAAITNAKVTLLNTNTGVASTRSTDALGRYLFDFVEPGTYTVSVEATGFRTFVQANMTVLTQGDVTVNAAMTIGELTQAVNVQEQAVALQFNSTTMSQTVVGKMLAELPVLARSPYSLTLLNPAVVERYANVLNPYYRGAASGVDVGGNTAGRNDMLIDGVPANLTSRTGWVPTMDAVQEVSVQQNSVSAEFGNSAGGVLSISMKSGTNQFHGTGYYFGRNPVLNAVSNSTTHTPNQVRNHVWGGTVGGPILKNRLFTFGSYEEWRNKEPHSRINTLPTDLERTGDFSQSLNSSNGMRVIYDPWSTIFNASTNTVTRTPFTGNRIPTDRIDGTARLFMNDIWKPNGPGDDQTHANNYKITYPWWTKYRNLSDRSDWNINDKWKMYARYSIYHTTMDNPNYASSPAVPSDNGGIINTMNVAADTVYILNASTVLNFRFGFSNTKSDYASEIAQLPPNGLSKYWPGNAWYQPYAANIPAIYYPLLTIGNFTGGFGATWFMRPQKYSYEATVAKSAGRHYIKVGASARPTSNDDWRPNLMAFTFNANLTANTFLSPNTKLSGDPFATFLLGGVDPSSNANYVAPKVVSLTQFAGFFQDDIKLNPRVTLNLGLRYEFETAPVEAQNRFSRYLDLTQPIPEMQQNPPVIPASVSSLNNVPYKFNGAWVFSDDKTRSLYNAPRTTFLPRAGIAVKVNDKTAVRFGFARYASPMDATIGDVTNISSYGYNATTNTAPTLQGVPGAVLSNPFPASNPLLMPYGNTLGRYTNLGGSASWFQQDLKQPINDRYNVTVQRQLPRGIRADVTYFMNVGRNAAPSSIYGTAGYGRSLNMSDPSLSYKYQGQLDKTVANPFYQYMTPQTFPGQLRNQATVTTGSLLVPYPQYGSLTQTYADGYRNRYYSLQMKAERSFNSGFSFTAAYNYAFEKTDAFFNSDAQYANQLSYLDSNLPRHRLALAGTVELPFGMGRRFLAHVNPLVNAILGGWSTSHVYSWRSGNFLRFGSLLASGDPVLPNPTPNAWFDTSVFKVLPSYTPRTNPWQYPGLTGPGSWNIDSTLSKSFPITERVRLEFRFEAYNLTNSLMWSDPNTTVTSSLFGRATNQANTGRSMQYSLRLHF